MKEFLMWLSMQLLIKMASSEWVLGFQIQQFVNLYNAEVRNGQYCCCDTSNTCVKNINHLTQCSALCDTYFKTFFPICSYNETCPNVMYNKVLENSPSAIGWKPVLQLRLDESNWNTKNVFMLEAWESDPWDYNDDEIDIFKIPMSGMVFNYTHYNSLTVEGENGIGKLTLSYYNITSDTSSCTSVNQPTSSTCSHNQNGSASISGSFSVSTKWMITTLQEATVTKIILPTATCKMTPDNNIKSTLLTTMTFPDISATVTMSAEIVLTILMWKTMAIFVLVIAVSLAITSIALGIIVYRIRKGTCTKSEPNSKFTIHKGIHPPVNDPATQGIHYHVDNTLYQQASVSDHEYFNTGPTDTQEENLCDLGSTTAEELASPYETPVPLGSKQ